MRADWIDWVTFFRSLAVASGTGARNQGGRPTLPYTAVTQLSDYGLNRLAEKFHMIPIPGGPGHLWRSGLADIHIRESTQ